MSKVVAMIPIKLKNERLPGKNIKSLGEKPLIRYILDTLLQVSGIDEIYVFCSDERIKEYLPPKVTFLKRDKKLDLPTSNFTQFFDSFMQLIDADTYVFTHATAPFLSASTIEICLDKVLYEDYDSAFSAVKIQDFLWKEGKPMNFDPSNLPRSQDLEPVYRETSGVYVFKKEVFLHEKRRIGKKPYIKEISWQEAVDINEKEDFEMAEMVLQTAQRDELNLIFDLDGVLIDSEKVQESAFYGSYKEVVGDNNCPDFSEYMKHTGDSLENIFRKMELPLEMAGPYRRISNQAIDKIIVNEQAVKFIKAVKKQHIKCGICTGKDRKRTVAILKYWKIYDLFDSVVCSDDVTEPKPSPLPTLLAIQKLGGKASVQNSILIGDGENDILSAKRAGVKSILALWYGIQEVKQEADYVAKTVDDLEHIINLLIRQNEK